MTAGFPSWPWLAGAAASTPGRVALAVGGAAALTWAFRRAARRAERRVSEHTTPLRTLQRTHTLAAVLASSGIVAVWLVAGLIVLSTLGVPVGAIFAGLGLAGIGLGFGAQDVVRDVLAGLFIILDDRYGVGDIVRINDGVAGRVEELTLRVTALRDLDGTLFYVNNGEIRQVANLSKEWSRALIDVPVAHDEDPARVREALDTAAARAGADPYVARRSYRPPEVLGIEALEPHAAVWRLVVDTKPGRQWDVQRRVREIVKEELVRRGVKAPALVAQAAPQVSAP